MFDFQLVGRTAIVCGSSRGLGYACATRLAEAGVEVVLNARTSDRLTQSADALSNKIGRRIRAVCADIATVEGRQELLAACPAPDILVTNGGGPPPGSINDWEEEHWTTALSTNMIAPIMLIKAVLPSMRLRRWGRIINITSIAVKMPLPRLGLSNGARSGLTGFIGGLAREVACDGITINNLLPGRFATERLRSYMADAATAKGVSPDAAMVEAQNAIPTGRLGDPDEFGAFCLFLASESAGFITGQNILLDGGEYNGVL